MSVLVAFLTINLKKKQNQSRFIRIHFSCGVAHFTSSVRLLNRGRNVFCFVLIYFQFCQITFSCIDVVICDPVHNGETVHDHFNC